MKKIQKYVLEVESPLEETRLLLQSETPFMAFAVGDLINTKSFSDLGYPFPKSKDDEIILFRVTAREHALWALGEEGLAHKLLLICEPVLDDRDARKGRARQVEVL